MRAGLPPCIPTAAIAFGLPGGGDDAEGVA
jgi:hypothetical protein